VLLAAVNRKLGLLSASLGITAWPLLLLALVAGGLDSSGSINPRVFVYPAGFFALSALILGLVGLIRGPQRILAALGFVAGILFVLSFVGLVPL